MVYKGNVRLGVLVMLVLIFALIIAACSVCARDVMRRKKTNTRKTGKKGREKSNLIFRQQFFFIKIERRQL